MILIASTEVALARRISKLISDEQRFAFSLEAALDRAREGWPTLILLDVRLGGNQARAVEWIGELLDASAGAPVVVVTRSPTKPEIVEMTALGAYTWLDREARDFAARLREVTAVARAAPRPRRAALSRSVH